VSGRDTILARVRAAVQHATPHPGAHPSPSGAASLIRFGRALGSAGGELRGPVSRDALGSTLLEWAGSLGASGRIVAEPSAAALLREARVETAESSDSPHAFADVDVAVACGRLGVAEDGAVAVLGLDAPHRSLLVLGEHLVLLLRESAIVTDLHAAFRALPGDALDHHHLTWIAGPSKTADIEQTLVHGAHGPRTLGVLVYNDEVSD